VSCSIDFKSLKGPFLLYKKVAEQYNDPCILSHISELVPEAVLKDKDIIPALLRWFKSDFMHWVPKVIKCPRCADRGKNGNDTTMEPEVIEGTSWQLRKVEVHTCPKCGEKYTFPRYAEVLKIAQTRAGRCSEWSMLFGAILQSLSFHTRIVHDYLDHCWNEVMLDGRWIHIDSTLQLPTSFNHPKHYEQNWGKEYYFVFAFMADNIQDVTLSYTEHWAQVQKRRMSLQHGDDLLPNLLKFYRSLS